jgi:hypothetical protein
MEEGQTARDKPAHCEGRTGREKHDRRTNHPIFGYGVTPSVLLWFVHLLCQGCDRPVGVATDRVAGNAIDADLSIGDRVVTYSVTRLTV